MSMPWRSPYSHPHPQPDASLPHWEAQDTCVSFPKGTTISTALRNIVGGLQTHF